LDSQFLDGSTGRHPPLPSVNVRKSRIEEKIINYSIFTVSQMMTMGERVYFISPSFCG